MELETSKEGLEPDNPTHICNVTDEPCKHCKHAKKSGLPQDYPCYYCVHWVRNCRFEPKEK